ncbi:MAG: DUF2306 domain-containing protein [Pseudohongiella sp.]|nr:DUF2306 domain-containing protein [Pseudohongiella sp.]
MINKIMLVLMTVSVVGVGIYAMLSALVPAFQSGFVRDMLETTPLAASTHFLLGAIVIVIGALQFNTRIRQRHVLVHRWFGRIYVSGVFIGGVAGLVLAFSSFGGLVTHVGFGLLAVCWLITTGIAFKQIRAGNISSHQNWMIRSYALTLGAVTLRIYLGLSQAFGLPFEEAYQTISWLAWVPNLIIAEWVFVKSRRGM